MLTDEVFCRPRRREAVVWPIRRVPKTRQLLPPGAAWQIPIYLFRFARLSSHASPQHPISSAARTIYTPMGTSMLIDEEWE